MLAGPITTTCATTTRRTARSRVLRHPAAAMRWSRRCFRRIDLAEYGREPGLARTRQPRGPVVVIEQRKASVAHRARPRIESAIDAVAAVLPAGLVMPVRDRREEDATRP